MWVCAAIVTQLVTQPCSRPNAGLSVNGCKRDGARFRFMAMLGGGTDIPGRSADLPAGTVTFLLTDIEGSTRLWETVPDAMTEALERHNRHEGRQILLTLAEPSSSSVRSPDSE